MQQVSVYSDTDILQGFFSNVRKIYLNVPFDEKDEAKSYGARFDWDVRKWYYTDESKADLFKKWETNTASFLTADKLTDEQQRLISEAKDGHNILVDACIGSGKTSTVQVLCNEMKGKKILYLTYNKLLKVDAQEKIIQLNTEVTNYHGFAYQRLKEIGVTVGVHELIQTYLEYRPVGRVCYDLLIIDEYQDIDTEISQMLEVIKSANPGVQIIAVGDMSQKIYDKTGLDVLSFMTSFLDTYVSVHFTKCFRISSDLARNLGNIWEKEIHGVNEDCEVSVMSRDAVVAFLSKHEPSEILCLGQRNGIMSSVLNELEREFSDKFNKKTVYASIRECGEGNVEPTSKTAIFTTFDGAKGLERDICVVFDFTEDYWISRINKPMVKYEIMRNIFCVAASRGKKQIVFVNTDIDEMYDLISVPTDMCMVAERPFAVSEMFDFKYDEDVEMCYQAIDVNPVDAEDVGMIYVKGNDELIDLSPCIGIWQESSFFDNYDIDTELKTVMAMHPDRPPIDLSELHTVDEKILALAAYETYQDRYMTQVRFPFITEMQKDAIFERLSTRFDGSEDVQGICTLSFRGYNGVPYMIKGCYDVFKNNSLYELKFKSAVEHKDFLQLACYLVMKNIKKGYLWNIQDGSLYCVRVPDKKSFLDKVVYTITKRSVSRYKAMNMV